MSLTRRLINLARANLNALIDGDDGGELDRFSDVELERELELRRQRKRLQQEEARAAREAAERAARERTRAARAADVTRPAGAPTSGREGRTAAGGAGAAPKGSSAGAAPRSSSAGGSGTYDARGVRDGAFASRGPRPPGGVAGGQGPGSRGPGPASASGGATSGSAGAQGGARAGSSRPPPGGRAGATTSRQRMAELYRTLETPVGASLDEVKHNFRRLVRLHHPDLNGGSPDEQRAATERTKHLTAAYGELELLLSPPTR